MSIKALTFSTERSRKSDSQMEWTTTRKTSLFCLILSSYEFSLSCLNVITARKRSFGQGNIFTPVCHSVHRVHDRGGACMRGEGRVWLGGCAWWGHACPGGVHGRWWRCMPGSMHGQGPACPGGMHAPPSPRPDTTRYGRSMSGRYASYWNAFLLLLSLKTKKDLNDSLNDNAIFFQRDMTSGFKANTSGCNSYFVFIFLASQ